MLLTKLNHKLKQISASGSPFRRVRKAYLYATHPANYLQRKQAYNTQCQKHELDGILKQMEVNGFASADEVIDTSLLRDLISEFENSYQKRSNASNVVNRPFVEQIIGPNDGLTTTSALVRFALQESCLKLAAAYFKQVPYLCNVQVIKSEPTNQAKWTESQLWHKDHDDYRMVKIFVYLNDVIDSEAGPFTFMPAKHSRLVKDRFFPGRISDEEMERQEKAQYAQQVTGKKGTSFFIDVANCYHQGSRCSKTRLAYIATYTTFANYWPYDNKIAIDEKSNLSPLQKLALRSC